MIFLKACEFLGVKPEDAVHVGDDRRNDIWGARDAGCDAWLWGSDVKSFKEVTENYSAITCFLPFDYDLGGVVKLWMPSKFSRAILLFQCKFCFLSHFVSLELSKTYSQMMLHR